jgi:hypothetical protein
VTYNRTSTNISHIEVDLVSSYVTWDDKRIESNGSSYNDQHVGTTNKVLRSLILHMLGKNESCNYLKHIWQRQHLTTKGANQNLKCLFDVDDSGKSRFVDLFEKSFRDGLRIKETVLPTTSVTIMVREPNNPAFAEASESALRTICKGINTSSGSFVSQSFKGALTSAQECGDGTMPASETHGLDLQLSNSKLTLEAVDTLLARGQELQKQWSDFQSLLLKMRAELAATGSLVLLALSFAPGYALAACIAATVLSLVSVWFVLKTKASLVVPVGTTVVAASFLAICIGFSPTSVMNFSKPKPIAIRTSREAKTVLEEGFADDDTLVVMAIVDRRPQNIVRKDPIEGFLSQKELQQEVKENPSNDWKQSDDEMLIRYKFATPTRKPLQRLKLNSHTLAFRNMEPGKNVLEVLNMDTGVQKNYRFNVVTKKEGGSSILFYIDPPGMLDALRSFAKAAFPGIPQIP